ncbi:MAG: hypothetical protein RSG92_15330 [Pseudomonas sp.]
MKTRLYRFTPHGGKPEHFTHDLASAQRSTSGSSELEALLVGTEYRDSNGNTWERIA